jgi:hypothetical protein
MLTTLYKEYVEYARAVIDERNECMRLSICRTWTKRFRAQRLRGLATRVPACDLISLPAGGHAVSRRVGLPERQRQCRDIVMVIWLTRSAGRANVTRV